MIIKNGLIYDDRSGSFLPGDVVIDGDRIANIYTQEMNVGKLSKPDAQSDSGDMNCCKQSEVESVCCREVSGKINCEQEIDASELYVIPGLIDIHFHGCKGVDFCDGTREALDVITAYQLSCGVTSICPATMSFDEDRLISIVSNARDYNYKSEKGAEIIGINMEGPFISSKYAGAQNRQYLCNPDVEMFRRIQMAAGGLIRLVDIAPELPGAMDFIDELSGDVNISVAHTGADYETVLEAFEKGANHVTHLYNGMPQFHHRNPGVIGAASDCENVFVELIADGVHVSPAAVRTAVKLYGGDRLVLISDSMMAAGMPDGEYELGGQKVICRDKRAVLSDGTIAGSAVNLMDCVRTCVSQMGISLADAIQWATVNPAKAVNVFDEYGSISIGKYADIVLVDKDLNIRCIISKGCIASR